MTDFQVVDAKREKIPLKIGLAGVSGSGKTYSSLLMARGLTDSWGKIGVVDCENNSAALYSDLPSKYLPDGTVFKTLSGGLKPPYSPEMFIKAISFWERQPIDVLIIDTGSKEWEGEGGVLEQVDRINANSKFQLTGWKELTPEHNKFIEKIVNSPLHIIVTLRSRTEYSIENEKGKTRIRKVGMRPVQREGFEYELTLFMSISSDHYAVAEKDRTSLFTDVRPFVITPDHGKMLLDWSNSGAEVDREVYYSGTPQEKARLWKLIQELGIKDQNESIQIAELIAQSRVPMSEFEAIATELITDFKKARLNEG